MNVANVTPITRAVTAATCAQTAVDRLFFLDVLKALSITAVVSFHAMFLPKAAYAGNLPILESAFAPLRFCVPVFLTISFLLMERSLHLRPEQSPQAFLKKRLARLAIPTLFWFGVAALLKLATGNSLLVIGLQILTGEIFTGAYYLIILFQLIPLYVWLRSRINLPKWIGLTIAVQCLMFLGLHVAFQSNFSSSLLAFLKPLNRAPFFYWFVYPVLGAYCYHALPKIQHYAARIHPGLKVILGLAMAGWLVGESIHLNAVLKYNLIPFDYLMVSCIFSVFVLLICTAHLTVFRVPKIWRTIIQTLSKYSLGIFCINGILSQIFLSIGSKVWKYGILPLETLPIIKILGWLVLLSASVGLSILLEKCRLKSIVC
jgi:Acyltransferase family